MDFPALLEGNPPQGLINGLGEVDRGMQDPGPGLAASLGRLSWAVERLAI